MEPRFVDRARRLIREDRDEHFVAFFERARLRALDAEDADESILDEERDAELALDVREAREPRAIAAAAHALADCAHVRELRADTAHAHQLAALGDDAEHALTDGDLRAEPRHLVATARRDTQHA